MKFIFLSHVFLFNIIFKLLFLIEIDFCNAGVIQGLVLNLDLYLVIFLNGACLSRIYSWSHKGFGMMHQCYCSEVLMCGASLLRSSLESILHDSILTNWAQIYWFFCLEHLKKYVVESEIVVHNLKWLLLNFLILYLERYNMKNIINESLSEK